MQPLPLISLLVNLVLAVTVLGLFYPRLREHIQITKARKQQLANARFVKQIRAEVRRYLQELSND